MMHGRGVPSSRMVEDKSENAAASQNRSMCVGEDVQTGSGFGYRSLVPNSSVKTF